MPTLVLVPFCRRSTETTSTTPAQSQRGVFYDQNVLALFNLISNMASPALYSWSVSAVTAFFEQLPSAAQENAPADTKEPKTPKQP